VAQNSQARGLVRHRQKKKAPEKNLVVADDDLNWCSGAVKNLGGKSARNGSFEKLNKKTQKKKELSLGLWVG